MDVLRTVRRAFALLNAPALLLLILAAANVLVAGLDMLGILLLVPLLAFLGPGGAPRGAFVDFAEQLLGTDAPERIVLTLALAATALFVAKSVAAVSLLWVQTGVLNVAQVSLSERILGSFVKAPWLVQQSSGTGAIIRTTINSVTVTAMTVVAGPTYRSPNGWWTGRRGSTLRTALPIPSPGWGGRFDRQHRSPQQVLL